MKLILDSRALVAGSSLHSFAARSATYSAIILLYLLYYHHLTNVDYPIRFYKHPQPSILNFECYAVNLIKYQVNSFGTSACVHMLLMLEGEARNVSLPTVVSSNGCTKVTMIKELNQQKLRTCEPWRRDERDDSLPDDAGFRVWV